MKNGCSVTEKVQIHLEKQNREAAPKMNSKWKRKKQKCVTRFKILLHSLLSSQNMKSKENQGKALAFCSIQFNSIQEGIHKHKLNSSEQTNRLDFFVTAVYCAVPCALNISILFYFLVLSLKALDNVFSFVLFFLSFHFFFCSSFFILSFIQFIDFFLWSHIVCCCLLVYCATPMTAHATRPPAFPVVLESA